ncbi:MAG: cupin domain-containing protein [Bacteroidales bacterium]|nr:cupin domain-containing protein [Bacteroidales bacterium]
MIIRLEEIPQSVLPAFKGGEKELRANMHFDGRNRMFKGCLVPGSSIGVHTHDDSCETIFIISGAGTILEIENGVESVRPVKAGDCLFCDKGQTHSLRNTSEAEDLVFYASVIQL